MHPHNVLKKIVPRMSGNPSGRPKNTSLWILVLLNGLTEPQIEKIKKGYEWFYIMPENSYNVAASDRVS